VPISMADLLLLLLLVPLLLAAGCLKTDTRSGDCNSAATSTGPTETCSGQAWQPRRRRQHFLLAAHLEYRCSN